jgi:RHS repeat-associated protein
MPLAFGGRNVSDLSLGYGVDVDVQTGAASLRVPIPAPPGRHDLAPALTLAYASGAGSSAFGAGWSLTGLPVVGIDTRFHVPRWDGTDGYQLGGDELVPWLEQGTGGWMPRGFVDGAWSVAFLRSRRGSSVMRVEKWVHVPTGRVHFRTRDARNVVTVYGARPDAAARIADPDDETRTLAWLPEVQIEPSGNALWFEYAPETLAGVDLRAPYERRRPSLAQRYLKRILYGNVAPLALDDALVAGTLPEGLRWCFQLVLDYGDVTGADATGSTAAPAWPARQDPFSTFRSGFEVRTYRLCRRFLAYHELDELGAGPTLVGALALAYDEAPLGSTLREITYTGYRRDGGALSSKSLPPLRMTYAAAATGTAFAEAPATAQVNAPAGLQGRMLSFVDLYGEGLAGMLTESDRAWYYKPNLGGGEFGAQTLVLERPATRPGTFGFGDVDRDGDTDLSQLAGRLAGLYELEREERTWHAFRPFAQFPHVEALGGRAQWVDLNGDGRADIVVVKEDAIVWFASDGEGFRAPVEVPLPAGAPKGTAADPRLDFFFADMTGDGLPDLVRVQNGRVEYWPSLGNGHFGAGVVMDGAPELAPDVEFDARRLRFVDLDGSGTTDLVYLGRGEVRCFLNAAGNQLVPGPRIASLPYLDNVSSVRVLDFLGDGRACLTWSSPLPGRERAIEYLPLTPAVQPRLLLSVDDSLGRQTSLTYSSSSAHYLRDVESGRGWSTKLPAHRPVVDRREVLDQIGNTRSVQRFEYHDGYYDGHEREPRGFGQVDVYDAEAVDGTAPGPGAAAFTAPSLVRTWFHLGTDMAGRHRSRDTYAGDPDLPRLLPHLVDDPILLSAEAIEDGLRALAGRMMRREVYAVGPSDVPAPVPFEIIQASFRLRSLQPAQRGAKAAFSVVPLEDATWTYEQTAGDPRVAHRVLVTTDDYDAPVRTATIGYARRAGHAPDVAAQGRSWVQIDDRALVNVDQQDRYELGIPAEGKSCELVGVRPGTSGLFTRAELQGAPIAAALAAPGPNEVDPPDDPSVGPAARLLSWDQSFYWDDAHASALPLGQVGTLTMVHHEEAACFTPAFVGDALGGRVQDADLTTAGYVSRSGVWWQVDPTHTYTPAAQFSAPASTVRGDGAITALSYDAYSLALTAVTDPLGNATTALIDYHQLAPQRLTDPNGNASEVRYDPLGVVVTTTSYGHTGSQPWGFDALAEVTLLAPATLADALAAPGTYLQGAASFVWYDIDAWAYDGVPTTVVSLTAEQLLHDGAGGGGSGGRIHVGVTYLDGLGRTLQEKTLVEPGLAIQRDGQGNVVVDAGGSPVLADAATRWRVSGHVVYDTKEHPGRCYEPFFSSSPAYEGDDVLQHVGVSVLRHYDAVGRAVGEDFPNGTFTSSVIGPWTVEQADANDNVAGSLYGALRQGLPADDPERAAYQEALPDAGTTRLTFLDPLGREAGSLARGGPTAADRRTETQLDITGAIRQVIDPRGLVAFTYGRDMAGRCFHEQGIDAGDAWSLPDGYGRVATTWDGRGFRIDRGYDLGDRPLYTHVTGGDGASPLDSYVETWAYGESLPDRNAAAQRNLLGRVVTTSDSAGQVTVDHYDPAGHVMSAARTLRTDVDPGPTGIPEPDWRTQVQLETDAYTTTALYDALGRVTTDTLPDGTSRAYEYLPSGPLSRVLVTTPDGKLASAPILSGTAYGARGERLGVSFGNSVEVAYGYNPQSYRLATQTATRGTQQLQGLQYTWDPVGNLVRLVDAAQQGPSPLISGMTAPARRDHTYDAHYRLLSATGRVHQALLQNDYVPSAPGTFMGTRRISLNDGTAIEPFTETYGYDASGNLLYVKHVGQSQSWTTNMWVSASSNRSLLALDLNGIPVASPESKFDAGGNLVQVAHLRQMEWTFRGALGHGVVTQRPGGTDDAERYVYGADGMRVRKVTTRVVSGGQVEVTEKVYVGDSERKRITRGGQLVFERWTTHVGDGEQRVALVYRWLKDDLALEVDDIGAPRVDYSLSTHQGSAALVLDASGAIISYEEFFPYGSTAFIAGDDVREVSRKEYRYSGKECDDFTGLYYYGFRYYAPWMGRWLSPDPIGPEDDLNLYQFVIGDPVGNVDQDGLDTVEPQRGRTILRSDVVGGLPPAYREPFSRLSLADQQRYTTGGAALLYTGGHLSVVSSEVYRLEQERAKAAGHDFIEHLPAAPAKDPKAAADADDAPTDGAEEVVVIAGKEDSTTGGGSGQQSEGVGDHAHGKRQDEGGGDARKGAKGKGTDAGDGTGKTGDHGKGDGEAGQAGRGGHGKGTGSGKGPGAGTGGTKLNGAGKSTSDVYSDKAGGARGGSDDGKVGGAPFSQGDTPGGASAPPSGPAHPSGSAQPGFGGRPVQSNQPNRPEEGPPPGWPSPPSNPSHGGPGGAGQDKQGRQDPYGWKNVLLDIAGMTNFDFGGDEDASGGGAGGVPGATGKDRSEWLQWLYIGTSAVNAVEMVTGFGEMVEGVVAAVEGLAKLGRRALAELPNMLRLGRRGLTRILQGLKALPGMLRRSGVRLLRGAEEETITLYRGVNESHTLFAEQSLGGVRPNHPWWKFWEGAASAYEHNVVPGATLRSPFTSWTTDPEVAMNFALRPGGGGVVIRAEVPLSQVLQSPNLKEVLLIHTKEVVSEAEYLVKGAVKGIATRVP